MLDDTRLAAVQQGFLSSPSVIAVLRIAAVLAPKPRESCLKHLAAQRARRRSAVKNSAAHPDGVPSQRVPQRGHLTEFGTRMQLWIQPTLDSFLEVYPPPWSPIRSVARI